MKIPTKPKKYKIKYVKMDNNNSKPKYHYVQCFVSYTTGNNSQGNTWEDVKKHVNEEGYEIYQMCSLQNYIVYLLRKEINYGVKEIQ